MKKSIQNAEHYNWKTVCDGWYLAKNSRYTVISEKMPPATREDMHRHKFSDQFFYLLSGHAEMMVEDEKIDLYENEGIEIKSGIWHQMINNSDQETCFLVFSSPDSHGDKQIGSCSKQ